ARPHGTAGFPTDPAPSRGIPAARGRWSGVPFRSTDPGCGLSDSSPATRQSHPPHLPHRPSSDGGTPADSLLRNFPQTIPTRASPPSVVDKRTNPFYHTAGRKPDHAEGI